MAKLSVNINKIAVLRNSRGGNVPNVLQAALDAERFGAEGITVHPRPDQRHIRYQDVLDLCKAVTTEFNIEGYPTREFLDLAISASPAQVTLVPDPPNALTSSAGWDTKANLAFLSEVCAELSSHGIRPSIFVNPDPEAMSYAAEAGAARVELYTEAYATQYAKDREAAILPFVLAAEAAKRCGLGLNAGHDLSLENLAYLIRTIPTIDEVSIGHALIADSLYLGFENTIQLYLRKSKGQD